MKKSWISHEQLQRFWHQVAVQKLKVPIDRTLPLVVIQFPLHQLILAIRAGNTQAQRQIRTFCGFADHRVALRHTRHSCQLNRIQVIDQIPA